MILKENAKLAGVLAIILLIVGVVCYAAGGPQSLPGDEPMRKVFMGVAGDVLFDHQAHTDYESDCSTCHHHGDGDESACDTCHLPAVPATVPDVCDKCHSFDDDPDMKDIHYEHHILLEEEPGTWTCKDCHQLKKGETLPAACSDCHDPADVEGKAKIMKYQKINDAMHSQCIGCHEDYGSGPVKCNECHAQ